MNNKIQQLIRVGLSKELLKNLSEGQINQLHRRMISEQVKGAVVVKKGTDPTQIKTYTDKGINVTMVEKEIDEDETDDVTDSNALGATALQDYTGQEAPHDANDMAPDGMDDDSDDDRKMMGMAEEKDKPKKKSKYNPWAICTSSVGRKDKKKYEKCVMDVKRNIKEGKNPYQVIVEMSLEKMVEKHISPRMTKGDLLKTLSEQGIIRRPMTNMTMGFVNDGLDNPLKNVYTSDMKEQGTKTAPPKVKPGTKEKEKPGKMDPFKNPKHQPKPKAKKDIEEQATKTAPAPTITKPGTKEKPGTSDPFKNPKHQPKPKATTKAPKMGKVEIPDYLTFDQLKINFKDQ